MKDFSTTQKLMMAVAFFGAIVFAVAVAGIETAVPAAPAHAAGLLTPF